MSLKDEQATIWANRSDNVILNYWNNRAHIRRCRWFAKQIEEYNFDSIFEIGIMGGRNIDILKNELPNVTSFGGIDVGAASVEFAKKQMPYADFSQQSIYELDTTHKYDMVFSAGVFIHIPPDGIDEAIHKCIQKAKRYVMHIEAQGEDGILKGPSEINPAKVSHKFQWKPQLVERYRHLGFNPEIVPIKDKNYSSDLSHLIKVNVEEFDGR